MLCFIVRGKMSANSEGQMEQEERQDRLSEEPKNPVQSLAKSVSPPIHREKVLNTGHRSTFGAYTVRFSRFTSVKYFTRS